MKRILALGLSIMLVLSVFSGVNHTLDSYADEQQEVKVKIHYHRYDDNYEGWNLWLWPETKDGAAYTFNGEDDYGPYLETTLQMDKAITQIGIIVRLNEWEAKDVDQDRMIQVSRLNSEGVLEIFLLQSEQTIYYEKDGVDLNPKFMTAQLSAVDQIEIVVTVPFVLKDSKDSFSVSSEDGTSIPIKHVTSDSPQELVGRGTIILEEALEMGKTYTVKKEGYGAMPVSISPLFSTEAFAQTYTYAGDDLGANYTPSQTTFKVWAPTATEVKLHLYKEGLGGVAYESHLMNPKEQGVYEIELTGDMNGIFYNYATTVNGITQEAVDPYARAVGANGKRGMVIDLSKTNPEGWETHSKPDFDQFTDAIIYELHVRDMSVSPNSGIENKGKYLGLIEEGTTNKEGLATGVDHLKELGITHLHLLPVFDYRTIDETTLDKNDFNWGYDPENYNVPEGSYATNPYEGDVRIREFKEMVKGLHENGIRVVMDVVYNHTGASQDSSLNKLVPDYYYRTVNGVFSNGSACGNETASERSMVRKLFVDSVVYWAKEYQIDGFRFDLMGLHDIETMNAIRKALDEVDPSILIYGEGWTGGASPLPQSKAALKKNTHMLPGIAAFSDDLRDGVKGHVFTDEQPGFVSGYDGMEESVKFGIVGATKHSQISYGKVNYSTSPWANEPSQSINYVAAHDNMTLWDKLAVTNPDDTEEDRKKMSMMADAIVLTSQGIPFIHAGSEFLRTKGGDENSYKSPDSVNQLDWSLKTENLDVFKYYQGLIALRKAHPSLRMQTNEEIQKNLAFFGEGDKFGDLQLTHKNMIGYVITNNANDDTAATLMTFFNANKEAKEVEIPEGTWQVLVKGDQAGTEVIDTITDSKIIVEPLSTMVLISDTMIPLQVLAASENDADDLEEVDEVTTEEIADVKTTTNRGLVGILLTLMALIIGGVAIVFGFKKFKK